MPECEKYMDLISQELDGELSESQRADLCAHLETCENCRRYRAALLAVEESLQEDLTEPPATLARSVMARVSALPVPGTAAGKKTERRALWRSIRSASLAAVAVLAIWSGVRLFSPKGGASEAPAAAPAAMADMAPAESARNELTAAPAAGAARYAAGGDTDAAEEDMPAEAALPMESAVTAEESKSAPASALAAVEIMKSGQHMLTAEDAHILQYIQTQLLAAAAPGEIPGGEADYVLTLVYDDGREEQLALWLKGDTLILHRDGAELAILSASAPEDFFRHIPE